MGSKFDTFASISQGTAGRVPAAWAGLPVLAVFLALHSFGALAVQAGQADRSPQPSMEQHYDSAFRYQDSGDLAHANAEYKRYLSMALHRLADGHANLGDYAHASKLFDEALRLEPEDANLAMDYANAALDAADWKKAKTLASAVLEGLSRRSQPADPRTAAVLGRALMELGEHKAALEQFELAARLHPTFDTLSQLAAAHMLLADKAAAQKIVEELPRRYGETPETYMKLGSLYGEMKFFDEAVAEFKKALAINPRLHGAHYSIGASVMMQAGTQAFGKAEDEFHKELEIDPANTMVYYPLGRISFEHHDYPEAETYLKRALRANPTDSSSYLLLGQLYRSTGQIPSAIAAYRKAIALTFNPSRNDFEVEQAHYWIGRLLVQTGSLEEGRKELDISRYMLFMKEQLTESRMSGGSLVQMPLGKTRDADPAELSAVAAFEKQSGPILASCYHNLAVNEANSGDFADAAAYFEQAERWNEALPGIDQSWGRAAYAAGDYAQAVKPLSSALAAQPEDGRTRGMLGISLCISHDYAQALHVLEPIQGQAGPGSEPAIAYAGARALSTGSSEDRAQLESLAQSEPNSPLAHYLLGASYAAAKQYSQSAGELSLAVKLDPHNRQAEVDLASADEALGLKSDALQILSLLAAASPRDAEILFKLATLQIESGLARDAIGNLEAAIEQAPGVAAYHEALMDAYRKNSQPEAAEREAREWQTLQEELKFAGQGGG